MTAGGAQGLGAAMTCGQRVAVGFVGVALFLVASVFLWAQLTGWRR